jgi:hypothetical protein
MLTLTICSWLLLALGIAMTTWLFPHPVAFIPYFCLLLAIIAARRLVTKAIVLLLTLSSVGVGFWYYWDAARIHLSTLNFTPLEVAIIESLVAGIAYSVVCRIEKVKHPANPPE